MKKKIRIILWKILGVSYDEIKRINDISSLSNDINTILGVESYHNGAYVSRTTDNPLKIGNYCSIAKGVWFILDDNFHQLSEITSSPLYAKSNFLDDKSKLKQLHESKWKGINVGNDVWIGMNSLIMPNVNIGNGVVIAAGAVVTKDVPDYACVSGVPAKIYKYRMEQEEIEKFLIIKWWNWKPSVVKKNYFDFFLPKEEFIAKHYDK